MSKPIPLLKVPLKLRHGSFCVVVETPKGSTVKLEYDPKLDRIVYSRPLLLGLSYPFDWGFFPQTLAADGDPLDAIIIHEAKTFPGVLLECRAIGVVKLTERDDGKRVHNDRVVCVPNAAERYSDARDVPSELQKELEEFFFEAVSRDERKTKRTRIEGWSGPNAASRLITAAHGTFRQKGHDESLR